MRGSPSSAGSQGAQGSSRLQEWWEGLPLCTGCLLVLCVATHLLNFLLTVNTGWLSISAARVIYHYEIYRLFTAAFTHGGILHILMNMMSLLSLGGSIERKFGTLQFAIVSLWTVILVGALYIFVCWVLAWYITGEMSWLWHSAVGYSGVLFAYAVIETHHSNVTHRSVFGLFRVPARVYPWVLLIVLQVLIPGISFLGHLSGILIGAMLVYGALNFLLPSVEAMQALEQSQFAGLSQKPQYVACANRDMSITRTEGGELVTAIGAGIWMVVMFVWNILVTLLHVLGCPPEDIASSCRRLWNTRWTSHGTYTGVPQTTQDPELGTQGSGNGGGGANGGGANY